jgi:hypothetical protein
VVRAARPGALESAAQVAFVGLFREACAMRQREVALRALFREARRSAAARRRVVRLFGGARRDAAARADEEPVEEHRRLAPRQRCALVRRRRFDPERRGRERLEGRHRNEMRSGASGASIAGGELSPRKHPHRERHLN